MFDIVVIIVIVVGSGGHIQMHVDPRFHARLIGRNGVAIQKFPGSRSEHQLRKTGSGHHHWIRRENENGQGGADEDHLRPCKNNTQLSFVCSYPSYLSIVLPSLSLKVWPNTALGCNHQSICMSSYIHAIQLLWYPMCYLEGLKLGYALCSDRSL